MYVAVVICITAPPNNARLNLGYILYPAPDTGEGLAPWASSVAGPSCLVEAAQHTANSFCYILAVIICTRKSSLSLRLA